MGLAVIDVPPGPPGWEESRAQLIRIVDPSGRAVAWFAPGYGAMCAGFAVRPSGQQGTEWTQILHATEPRESSQAVSAVGCIVRYALNPDFSRPMQPWRYIARDPTALIMETVIPTDAGDGLHLHLTAHLDAAALVLDLDMHNQSTGVVSPQIAFHLSFGHGLVVVCSHGDVRPALVAAPGCDTRVIVTLAPGASTVCQMLPIRGEAGTLALRAYASPAYGVPLASGARSRFGISMHMR